MSRVLETLTEAQRAAVTHTDGPLLVLSGPGSGKTRVVTHRIAYLLEHGVAADQILALTFTNKAAAEMQQRLGELAGDARVWMGTFHRFCAQLLRRHAAAVGLQENFSILDAADSRRMLSTAVEEAEIALTHVTIDQLAYDIGHAKANLVTPDRYVPRSVSAHGAMVRDAYTAYQRRLLISNAVDFDDLLMHVATLLREQPELRRVLDDRYRYLLVDEYQDTNFAQYAIARSLSCDHPNLAVTGDPDQSIYGWRGANLSNILDFEQDFPEVRVIRLEQNYRSTKAILRVADALIAHNKQRMAKALYTDNAEGERVRLVTYGTSVDEAEQIANQIAWEIREHGRRPRDFGIFYRVNALSRGLETALGGVGIPIQIVRGIEFYQRQEVKDILAYLQLINNPRCDAALERIINTPPRQIGKTTVSRLRAWAQQKRVPLFEACRQSGVIDTIGTRAATRVATFVAMIDGLSAAADELVEEIVGRILSKTEYEDWLEHSAERRDADRRDADRRENVRELLSAAREFDARHPDDGGLERFLEETALVNDIDGWEDESDRVSLMTLHAAKGLEFPVVFVIAVEQGYIPHERNREESRDLEEERRLLFVALTRAREKLQLSRVQRRFSKGTMRTAVASPFLFELPRDEMEVHEPPAAARRPAAADSDEAHFEAPSDEWDGCDEAPAAAPAPVAAPAASSGSSPAIRLMTAAELANEDTVPPEFSPEQFEHGMLVKDPEYGLGRIIALSGEGRKRIATVQFFQPSQEKTILLAFSELKPVKSA